MCAGPSCTTCASCGARRPRSRKSADHGRGRVAGYAELVTDTESADPSNVAKGASEGSSEATRESTPEQQTEPADEPAKGKKRSTLREAAILATIAVVLYAFMLTFVGRPYLIPSESMEPTLH